MCVCVRLTGVEVACDVSSSANMYHVTLTVCLGASAAYSDLSASPCRSSAAQPDEHGTPLPPRPTRPPTFCCRAEAKTREGSHFTSRKVFTSGWSSHLSFILRAPPSSASSCTSCWGPGSGADRCATVSRWPPTESVCLLQEDSPDPLMSRLVRKQRILRHERNVGIRIYCIFLLVQIICLISSSQHHLLTLVQADVLHLLLGHLA